MQMDKVDRAHWAVSDAVRRVLPPYAPFFKHLPYLWEYDDHTIRCRDSELMISLEVEGIDASTSTETDVENLTQQFADILKGLDDRWTFYIHRLTRPTRLHTKRMAGESFQAAVDQSWRAHMTSAAPRNSMNGSMEMKKTAR